MVSFGSSQIDVLLTFLDCRVGLTSRSIGREKKKTFIFPVQRSSQPIRIIRLGWDMGPEKRGNCLTRVIQVFPNVPLFIFHPFLKAIWGEAKAAPSVNVFILNSASYINKKAIGMDRASTMLCAFIVRKIPSPADQYSSHIYFVVCKNKPNLGAPYSAAGYFSPGHECPLRKIVTD